LLTAPWLINHRACPSLGDAELRLKLRNRCSLPGRAYQFPSENCFSLLASSHFIPPTITVSRRCRARHRSSVESLTHKACSTAAKPLPALHIASASRSFAAISSGRCFFRRLVIESLFAHWVVDLHTDWIRISKAGHFVLPVEDRPIAPGAIA